MSDAGPVTAPTVDTFVGRPAPHGAGRPVAAVAVVLASAAVLGLFVQGLPLGGVGEGWKAAATLLLAATCLVASAIIWLRGSGGWAPSLLGGAFVATAVNAVAMPALSDLPRLDAGITSVTLSLSAAALACFPSGLVARWAGWLVGAYVCWEIASVALPQGDALGYVGGVALFGVMGALTVAQVRHRVRASAVEREQLAWFAYGIVVWFSVSLVVSLPYFAPGLVDWSTAPGAPYDVFQSVVASLALAAIPVCTTIAVVRWKLYDVHLLIGRTLLYGLLSLLVTATYLVIVLAGSAVGGTRVAPLVAAAVAALLAQPVRSFLQTRIRRRVYGLRAEPETALARLAARLGESRSDEDTLTEMVTTIRSSLRVPGVSVQTLQGTEFATAAAAGVSEGRPVILPLWHQGVEVGRLVITTHERDGLPIGDRDLLEALASQAGPVVQGVRLSRSLRDAVDDLREARERLVVTREEERRRLRRNLHDELAPTLAAAGLTASTAADLVARDPARAGVVLDRLEATLASAVEDIRRLAHELRPPALDEHGLVGALREHAVELASSLPVLVEAAELPELPAAVEVAAYRISLEALHNVTRHARATGAVIRLSVTDGWLDGSIADDGTGFEPGGRSGMGQESMRERAAELGGTTTVTSSPGAGTVVRFRLPVAPIPTGTARD
jgi:signal transduction histidine kinase